MEPHVLIFILTIVVFVPCAGVLLYVWHKYGSDEHAVTVARTTFILGVIAIFGLLVIV